MRCEPPKCNPAGSNLRGFFRCINPMHLYRELYKNKFFNKVFVAYLLITLVANCALFFLLSGNLTQIKTEQSMEMSDQVLVTMDAFLTGKVAACRSIHQKLYRDRANWPLLMSRLDSDTMSSLSSTQFQALRDAVVLTAHSIDSQINSISLYGYEQRNVIRFTAYSDLLEDTVQLGELFRWSGESTQLLSGRGPNNRGNSFSLFVCNSVRSSESLTRTVGMIAMRFDAMNLRQSYRRFDKYIKGRLLLLNSNGELLFDSGKTYDWGEFLPDPRLLAETGVIQHGGHIYNVLRSSDEYVLINDIGRSEIDEDVRALKISISQVMLLVIAVALALTFFATKVFSTRLHAIAGTMQQMRGGKLTGFPARPQSGDEVGYIHDELLRMCEDLNGHIQREYVYALKQKEMELYALQTQINPHFLFNSLEAIRMGLHLGGDAQAARMIRILSELFRSMMSREPVVTNREEIGYIQSYLELYKYRLGERMQFVMDISEDVYRYATLRQIIQPLVENALNHGILEIATTDEPGKIVISAWRESEDVIFSVRDDGKGIPPEALAEIEARLMEGDVFHESIGIYNVNSRLKIVYGPSYRLRIVSEEGFGTTVTVRTRAMTMKELKDCVQSLDRG